MTTHGAFSVLMKSARRARGCADDASDNIKALYATGTLPEDASLTAQLNAITALFRSAEQKLEQAKQRTYKLAENYLEENRDKVKKRYTLRAGSPSMRKRRPRGE